MRKLSKWGKHRKKKLIFTESLDLGASRRETNEEDRK